MDFEYHDKMRRFAAWSSAGWGRGCFGMRSAKLNFRDLFWGLLHHAIKRADNVDATCETSGGKKQVFFSK
jgi:hypothetical protein